MFFSLAPMLRSLTMTPAGLAIDLARRIARHHLGEGGVVTRPSTAKSNQAEADFVLPAGVDPVEVARRYGRNSAWRTVTNCCVLWSVGSWVGMSCFGAGISCGSVTGGSIKAERSSTA
jgi:hypothetical protein